MGTPLDNDHPALIAQMVDGEDVSGFVDTEGSALMLGSATHSETNLD